MSIKILHGDCRDVLRTLPAESVQCVVTSPPYYGLRDYGVEGQIGLESSPGEYVAKLVDVFHEVRRVLRDDGVVLLNLGDSYASGGNGVGMGKQLTDVGSGLPPKKAPTGYKPKDLLGVPWRVAFALQADGWWLRSAIVWAKPNPMPESVTDRPTSAYEMVFLLAKSERYFWDAEAVREEFSDERRGNPGSYHRTTNAAKGANNQRGDMGFLNSDNGWNADGSASGRNIRNVWTIATTPYTGAHFATMPPELAERCIKAGTSERGCCPHCGAPWGRVVEKGAADLEHQRACGGDANGEYSGQSIKGHDAAGVQNASDVKRRILAGMVEKRTTDWRPTCCCPAHDPVPCTVLDPFGGAGTTGLVADRLGRDAVLIELNPDYGKMAAERITDDSPLFANVAA